MTVIPALRRNRGLVAITCVSFALYLAYSVSNYLEYRTSSYDLGIFDQAIRSYSHFRDPIAPLKSPGHSLLGDHFHPILAVLAPLYWVWNNPVALLTTQAFLIAASVPVVHRFAARKLHPRTALVVTAAYGVAWPLQSMVNFEFHEVAFAVPLLALAIDALDRADLPRIFIWSFLLLLVKEDMGIVVATLGIVLWSRGRLRAVREATNARAAMRAAMPLPTLILVAGGLAAYVLVTATIIPALSPSNHFSYWSYTELGNSLPHALGSIITSPLRAARLFVNPDVKLHTLLALVLPALPALASRYFVIAVPLLAELFFSTNAALWSRDYHYDALPWVALTLASIDGIANLSRLEQLRQLAVERWAVGATAAATAAFALVAIANADFGSRLTNWAGDEYARAWRAGQAMIPSNACVLASNIVAGHLSSRDYVTLPNLPLKDPDFLIIDPTLPSFGGRAPTAEVVRAAEAQGYVTVYRRHSVLVLRSPAYAGPTPRCKPLGQGPTTRSR